MNSEWRREGIETFVEAAGPISKGDFGHFAEGKVGLHTVPYYLRLWPYNLRLIRGFNYCNPYHIGWFGDPGRYGTAKNTANLVGLR